MDIFMRLQALGWTNTNHPLFAVKQAQSLGFGAVEAADYARQWAAGIGYSDPDAAAVIGRAVFSTELRNEARTVLRRIEESGAAATEIAGALVALEDPEGALRMLERAQEQGDPQLVSVLVDPTFDPLRREARFERIVQGLDSNRRLRRPARAPCHEGLQTVFRHVRA